MNRIQPNQSLQRQSPPQRPGAWIDSIEFVGGNGTDEGSRLRRGESVPSHISPGELCIMTCPRCLRDVCTLVAAEVCEECELELQQPTPVKPLTVAESGSVQRSIDCNPHLQALLRSDIALDVGLDRMIALAPATPTGGAAHE